MVVRFLLAGLCVCGALAHAQMQASPLDAYGDFLDFVEHMGSTVLILTGCGTIMGSLVQYIQHRKNPSSTRLSKPVFLFVMGLLLIGLAFLPDLVPQSTMFR